MQDDWFLGWECLWSFEMGFWDSESAFFISCILAPPQYQHHVFDFILVIILVLSFSQRGWPTTSGAWLGHLAWISRWLKWHLQAHRLCLLTYIIFVLCHTFAWNLEISKELVKPKIWRIWKTCFWNFITSCNKCFGLDNLLVFEINIMVSYLLWCR